jgi:hypothetical protein
VAQEGSSSNTNELIISNVRLEKDPHKIQSMLALLSSSPQQLVVVTGFSEAQQDCLFAACISLEQQLDTFFSGSFDESQQLLMATFSAGNSFN